MPLFRNASLQWQTPVTLLLVGVLGPFPLTIRSDGLNLGALCEIGKQSHEKVDVGDAKD